MNRKALIDAISFEIKVTERMILDISREPDDFERGVIAARKATAKSLRDILGDDAPPTFDELKAAIHSLPDVRKGGAE